MTLVVVSLLIAVVLLLLVCVLLAERIERLRTECAALQVELDRERFLNRRFDGGRA